MSYRISVIRVEKAGPYVLPLTMKTYNPETIPEFDDLITRLCEQYKNRKDVRITSPGHVVHKDWDAQAVLDGYLYPGQYTTLPGHEGYAGAMCWNVYDPMRRNEFGERYCIAAHVSYREACRLTGQECPEEEEYHEEGRI